MTKWTKIIAEDWRQHSYYQESEQWVESFWNDHSVFRHYFDKLNPARLLDLACGHGRHSAKVLDRIETLTLVDVNEENIAACRKRFSDRHNIAYLVNNGEDLSGVPSNSHTGVFCYDAMVHFEASVVIGYLAELFRVLVPGGRAVLHYSNMDWMPGLAYGDAPHMRNFFSETMMLHFAQRSGLDVIAHTTLDWGGNPVWRSLDALILLEKPSSSVLS